MVVAINFPQWQQLFGKFVADLTVYMDLFTSFKAFTDKENLFSPGDGLLLAVSGGLDSVVLCELCHRAGYGFRMAHGNFQLRGAESERDEQFVRQLALKYGCELFVKRFDTQQYTTEHKVSIQVAARELRYAWFHELIADMRPIRSGPAVLPAVPHSPTAARALLLTAHHLDDNIETLLMNFFKGTGIAGLHGILPRQGEIVRPLLFAGKDEIRQFAREQGLEWVEDSSNESDKYTRNYMRHQVIPLVERLYPGVLANLGDNIGRFREIEELYRQSVERHRSGLMERKGEEVHIPALKLRRSTPLHSIVYEIIREFGFSPRQVEDVVQLLDSESGKYLLSSTHRILKNRRWLIIAPRQSASAEHILIESVGDKIIYANGELRLEILSGKPSEPPEHSELADEGEEALRLGQNLKGRSKPIKNRMTAGNQGMAAGNPTALLDAASIQFPLLLRKWRQGDYFYPLGMRKKKKLGRFFIDNKFSLADKERAWVIEMDKKIIWVVGFRIDDRFRIRTGTREVLKIESRVT